MHPNNERGDYRFLIFPHHAMPDARARIEAIKPPVEGQVKNRIHHSPIGVFIKAPAERQVNNRNHEHRPFIPKPRRGDTGL